MISYDFLTTSELGEALEFLDRLPYVKIIAGGTDVLVNIHNKSERLPKINYLLNIGNIERLKYVQKVDQFIEIGPLVTHTQLLNNLFIKEEFPIIVHAASHIGSTQIRNRGTIGGNICNASPAADLLPPLIALKAELVLTGKNRKRTIPLRQFLTGPYKHKLQKKEILTKIRIPLLSSNYYTYFQKIGRRKALSISRLNLAVVVKIDNNDFFQDVGIVPGSATPYPQHLLKTEKRVIGQSIQTISPEEIGRFASEEVISITGVRWSTPYKKPVISSLVERAIKKIIKEKRNHE